MAPKGKWAQGITPRNFCWVIKDKLAVCERPGGYGPNHRRVRRQEEIIWIREQGFSLIVSLLPSPHNLHNYDELGVRWAHRPFAPADNPRAMIEAFFPELRDLLRSGGKILVHRAELGDPVIGLMAGYLLWTGLVPEGPRAISIMEQITQRGMGPVGRQMVALARTVGTDVGHTVIGDAGSAVVSEAGPAVVSDVGPAMVGDVGPAVVSGVGDDVTELA